MLNTIKIKIIDPAYCKTLDKPSLEFVRTLLFYEKEYWRPGRYHKEAHITKKYLIDRHGNFLTGFLPKIRQHIIKLNYQLELHGTLESLPYLPPSLPGITFRPDQLDLIEKAVSHQRGVLKAPARSGKTVVASGILSSFSGKKALFLCHTLSLLAQTETEFLRFGFDVGVFSGLRKELNKPLTLATHQSFVKRNPKDYCDEHDIIMIDECHHVASLDGNYAKILKNSLAPYKIGLTATLPERKEQEFAMEGLLGPIIGEITSEEGQELGFLSKPKLIIHKVPVDLVLKKYKTYSDIYRNGIMLNRAYNRLIVNTSKEYIKQGMTVLILVNRVQHGFFLKDIFEKILPELEVPFLCGGIDSDSQNEVKRLKKQLDKLRTTSPGKVTKTMNKIKDYIEEIKTFERKIKELSKDRDMLRQKLDARKIPCVIATNVWNEGINIPSLNVLINGGGGKSEVRSIQIGSRSLTAHEDKEYGIIVDFFNPNHVKLIEHFGERFSTYCDLSWV